MSLGENRYTYRPERGHVPGKAGRTGGREPPGCHEMGGGTVCPHRREPAEAGGDLRHNGRLPARLAGGRDIPGGTDPGSPEDGKGKAGGSAPEQAETGPALYVGGHRRVSFPLSRRAHLRNGRNADERDGMAVRDRSRAAELPVRLAAPPGSLLGRHGDIRGPRPVRKKVFFPSPRCWALPSLCSSASSADTLRQARHTGTAITAGSSGAVSSRSPRPWARSWKRSRKGVWISGAGRSGSGPRSSPSACPPSSWPSGRVCPRASADPAAGRREM